MSLSMTELAALEAALARGEITVSYEGKTVTYASADDLLKRIDYVRRVVGVASPSTMTGMLTQARPVRGG